MGRVFKSMEQYAPLQNRAYLFETVADPLRLFLIFLLRMIGPLGKGVKLNSLI